MQHAELAEVAPFGQAVVERAVAPIDLHHATAHDVPEQRLLTELDDACAGLAVAHIDGAPDAQEGIFIQILERRVLPQEPDDVMLFVVHSALKPWVPRPDQ